MRKQQFIEVAEKYPELAMKLKMRAFLFYRDIVRQPVLAHKRKVYN